MADNRPTNVAPDAPDVIATRKQVPATQVAPTTQTGIYAPAAMRPPLSANDTLKPSWTPDSPTRRP